MRRILALTFVGIFLASALAGAGQLRVEAQIPIVSDEFEGQMDGIEDAIEAQRLALIAQPPIGDVGSALYVDFFDYDSATVGGDFDADGRDDLLYGQIFNGDPTFPSCFFIQTDYFHSAATKAKTDQDPTTGAPAADRTEFAARMMVYVNQITTPNGATFFLNDPEDCTQQAFPSIGGNPHQVNVDAVVDPTAQCETRATPADSSDFQPCKLLQIFDPTSTGLAAQGASSGGSSVSTQRTPVTGNVDTALFQVEQWTRLSGSTNLGPHLVLRVMDSLVQFSATVNGVGRPTPGSVGASTTAQPLFSAPFDFSNLHLLWGGNTGDAQLLSNQLSRLDLDDDGRTAFDEIVSGSNPINGRSVPADRDGDGAANGIDKYPDDPSKFRDFDWTISALGTTGIGAGITQTTPVTATLAAPASHVHLKTVDVYWVRDRGQGGTGIDLSDLSKDLRYLVSSTTCGSPHDCGAPSFTTGWKIDDIGHVDATTGLLTDRSCAANDCVYTVPDGQDIKLYIEITDDGVYAGQPGQSLTAILLGAVFRVSHKTIGPPNAPSVISVVDVNDVRDLAGTVSDHIKVTWTAGTASRSGSVNTVVKATLCPASPAASQTALAIVSGPANAASGTNLETVFAIPRTTAGQLFKCVDSNGNEILVGGQPARGRLDAVATTSELIDGVTRTATDTKTVTALHNVPPTLNAATGTGVSEVTQNFGGAGHATVETAPMGDSTVRFRVLYKDDNGECVSGSPADPGPQSVKLIITKENGVTLNPAVEFSMAREVQTNQKAPSLSFVCPTGEDYKAGDTRFVKDLPVSPLSKAGFLTIGKTYEYKFQTFDRHGNAMSQPTGVPTSGPDATIHLQLVTRNGAAPFTVRQDAGSQVSGFQESVTTFLKGQGCDPAKPAECPDGIKDNVETTANCDLDGDGKVGDKPIATVPGAQPCKDVGTSIVQPIVDGLVEDVTEAINGAMTNGLPNPWTSTRCDPTKPFIGQTCTDAAGPNQDSDKDSFTDADEDAADSDPAKPNKYNPFSTPLDTDADLLPNLMESTSLEVNVWKIVWVRKSDPNTACTTAPQPADCQGVLKLRDAGTRNIIIHGGAGSNLFEISETPTDTMILRANEGRYSWTLFSGVFVLTPHPDWFQLTIHAEDKTLLLDSIVHLNKLGVAGSPVLDVRAFGATGDFGAITTYHREIRFEVMTNPFEVMYTGNGRECSTLGSGIQRIDTSSDSSVPLCPDQSDRKTLAEHVLDLFVGAYIVNGNSLTERQNMPDVCDYPGPQAKRGTTQTWFRIERHGDKLRVCGQARGSGANDQRPFGPQDTEDLIPPFVGVADDGGQKKLWLDQNNDRVYQSNEALGTLPPPPCDIGNPQSCANPMQALRTALQCQETPTSEDIVVCAQRRAGEESSAARKTARDNAGCGSAPDEAACIDAKANGAVAELMTVVGCAGLGPDDCATKKATETIAQADAARKTARDTAGCGTAADEAACAEAKANEHAGTVITAVNGILSTARSAAGCDPGEPDDVCAQRQANEQKAAVENVVRGPLSCTTTETIDQCAARRANEQAGAVLTSVTSTVRSAAGCTPLETLEQCAARRANQEAGAAVATVMGLLVGAKDTDGDGYETALELQRGSNPFNKDSTPSHSGGGFPRDFDGDGFFNEYELQRGSDPNKACSTPSNPNGGVNSNCRSGPF